MMRQEGASAVEFALLVPVLVAIFFGITQFGVIFMQDLAVSNAARQGARLGAQDGNDCGSVRAAVFDSDGSVVFTGTNTRVSVGLLRGGNPTPIPVCTGSPSALPCAGALQGDRLRVEVEFDNAQLVIPRVWNNAIVLERDAVFQCEYWS